MYGLRRLRIHLPHRHNLDDPAPHARAQLSKEYASSMFCAACALLRACGGGRGCSGGGHGFLCFVACGFQGLPGRGRRAVKSI